MSDEKRLDRIEEKLDSVVKESSELRGEIRQFMTNSASYTAAVSSKATQVGWDCDKKTEAVRASLEAHEKSPDAHGAGVKREIDGKIVGWATVAATALASCGGVIGWLVHKVGVKQ